MYMLIMKSWIWVTEVAKEFIKVAFQGSESKNNFYKALYLVLEKIIFLFLSRYIKLKYGFLIKNVHKN